MKNSGYSATENTKRTQVDLLAFKDNIHLFNIETEIKRVWSGPFKYQSVQIPERKGKFCNLEKPTLFVMHNADQTEFLVIKDTDILASPCVEVPNKFVWKGEKFYQIPIEKVYFNDILTPIKEILNDKT